MINTYIFSLLTSYCYVRRKTNDFFQQLSCFLIIFFYTFTIKMEHCQIKHTFWIVIESCLLIIICRFFIILFNRQASVSVFMSLNYLLVSRYYIFHLLNIIIYIIIRYTHPCSYKNFLFNFFNFSLLRSILKF